MNWLSTLKIAFFIAIVSLGSFEAHAQVGSQDEGCRHRRNVSSRADTPLSASVSEIVKANIVEHFSGVAVDVEKFRKDLTDKLDEYEKAHRDKEGFDLNLFRNKKADAIKELNDKLSEATGELAAKVDKFGKDIGDSIEKKINSASPNVTGLAQYGYCKDEFDPGTPGWSHVGKLGISGVQKFNASGTLELGPLDLSLKFGIPGFADLTFSGTLKYSISCSISGSLTPDEPTDIDPLNRPIASADVLVDFPITGKLSSEVKTGIIGSAGDIEIEVNTRIGPVKLNYEAKEK
jgi:hypothetical protein